MEAMVAAALESGMYEVTRNVVVGSRFGVSSHRIDTRIQDARGRVYLASLKWQQVSGTAEQKIPFEVICLADLLTRNETFYKAYLVLGGDGWRYKNFYLSGGLDPHLTNARMVSIVSLEEFVSRANRGRL